MVDPLPHLGVVGAQEVDHQLRSGDASEPVRGDPERHRVDPPQDPDVAPARGQTEQGQQVMAWTPQEVPQLITRRLAVFGVVHMHGEHPAQGRVVPHDVEHLGSRVHQLERSPAGPGVLGHQRGADRRGDLREERLQGQVPADGVDGDQVQVIVFVGLRTLVGPADMRDGVVLLPGAFGGVAVPGGARPDADHLGDGHAVLLADTVGLAGDGSGGDQGGDVREHDGQDAVTAGQKASRLARCRLRRPEPAARGTTRPPDGTATRAHPRLT